MSKDRDYLIPLVEFIPTEVASGRLRPSELGSEGTVSGVLSLALVPVDPHTTTLPFDKMMEYDWEQVDDVVAGMAELRVVVIGLCSQAVAVEFVEMIEPRLPRLRDAGKLRYAILTEYSARVRTQPWSWRPYEHVGGSQRGQ